jgi:protein-disulfide isomerase
MWGRLTETGLSTLLSFAVLTSAARGQEPSTEDLRKEIQAIQDTLKAMQKDLQDIKGMMARQAPAPSGVGAVIDYGNSPVKGERTAKLTLVEFSDYQ